MTTGLITIHDIYNYGSILQAYATRRAVQSLSKPLQIIDYKYPNALHKDSLFRPTSILAATLKIGNRFLKDTLPGRPYTAYVNRYDEAKNTWYGEMTRPFPSREALLKNPPLFSTYMVGSDQVWHPRSASRDPTFFLDFAPAGSKRVSYASSFGSLSVPPNLMQSYSERLGAFDELGVREKSGVRLVRALTGRDATLTLDPTLLFDGEFWKKEAVMPDEHEPYIVCYGTNQGTNYMERLAVHLARQSGLKIIRLNGKFHNAFNRKMKYVLDAGPREWLGYLAEAELVIGQSFHATAFAVSFKRPLIALLRGNADHDSRQLDFLDSVDLGNTVLTIGSPFPDFVEIVEPDYSDTERLLSEHRERSMNYLKRALDL